MEFFLSNQYVIYAHLLTTSSVTFANEILNGCGFLYIPVPSSFFFFLVTRSESHTKQTTLPKPLFGMNDVPFYIEFTPRDYDTDIEIYPPSCPEDSSLGDDASSFAEQKFEVMKPTTHDIMSHSNESSQQDLDAPFCDIMPSPLMMSHPGDESRQDLDAMDWMVHDLIRQEWLHQKVSPAIIKNDDMKVAGTIEQQDLDVTASDLQQMILHIRYISTLALVNQCTLSFRATNRLVNDADNFDSHASTGVSESPMTSCSVTQPSEVFTRKVSQTQSMYSSLRPGAAMTLSSTIPPQTNYSPLRYLTTHYPATPSYCQECYAPCSRPPLMMCPKPKKRVEDIPGFNICKFGPMPIHWPRAA